MFTNNTTDFTILQWNDYLKITAYSLLLTIGCFMNFVSFIYFGFKTQRMKSNYRYFIAHLSFADLLCCLMVPTMTIIEIINNGDWVFGKLACTYFYPIGRLTGVNSAWILCGMTYERYRTFTNPFKPLRKRTTQIYLALTWFITVSVSLSFSLSSVKLHDNKCFMQGKSVNASFLNIMKTHMKITLPCCVMVVLCVRLKTFLVKENRRRKKNLNAKLRTDKSEKVVLYSVISYLVCVLPTLIGATTVNVKNIVKSKTTFAEHKETMTWILILFYSNNVVNVFIYAGRFKDFRKYIFSWIGCGRRKKNIAENFGRRSHEQSTEF